MGRFGRLKLLNKLIDMSWKPAEVTVVATEPSIRISIAEIDESICPNTDKYIQQTLTKRSASVAMSSLNLGSLQSPSVQNLASMRKTNDQLFTAFSEVNIDGQIVNFKDNYEVISKPF